MGKMTSQLIPSDFDVNALDVVAEVLCPREAMLHWHPLLRSQVTRAGGDECSPASTLLVRYLQTTILFTLNTLFSFSLRDFFLSPISRRISILRINSRRRERTS